METISEKTFSFGDFELNGAKRTLLKCGEAVALNSKTFDLLLILVENNGQILSKNELLDTVWEGSFVEENNLTVQISALRKIFGEKKNEHKFIATIPGKGYKFVAEISVPVEKSNGLAVLEKTLPIAAVAEKVQTTLIGRDSEIAEIKDLLRQTDIRLLTLTGAGGSGKTSLARVVAVELKTDFADGVFFVELAAATESNFVVSAIAQTLEITEASDKPLIETITDFLRTRKILLVLDNFEQVLLAAPILKELLAKTASLKITVTSRALLHLTGEREFTVLPLDLPPRNAVFSIENLDEYPAIALFCERACEVKPNFVLTDENASSIAEICRRLDGLPLAIELAAARVKLLAPSAILERLENSLKLLTGGANNSPERQRTMRDTIRWSYDLLAENERFLFRRLSIFAGGFTVEAAEFLSEPSAGAGGLSLPLETSAKTTNVQFPPPATADGSDSVLDLLDSLIENNLIVSKDQPDGNVRLRMLEVVREFAFEILRETGEFDDLQLIHTNYFLSFAEKAAPFLQGENSIEWHKKLETEHDNLRAALDWSLKNNAQTAARIAAALRFFWLNHSHLSEGLRWSKAALQATENTVSKARSELLLSNGVFLRSQGDLATARKFYEKTLEESRQINDLLQIIKAHHGLAAIAVLEKDFDSAQDFIEESLALSRELNDEMQTAYSLASLGDLEMSRENLSAARPLLEECLTLSKKLGNDKLLTVTYYNLGTIDYFDRSFQAANFKFAESLQIAKELSNLTMISCSLDGFAALAASSGNPEQAAKLAGAAESLRESIGYKIEPAEEIFCEKYLTKVRARLDEKTFAELYKQGKRMTLDEAVALTAPPAEKAISGKADFQTSEIIIENHSFSRIAIEEIDDLYADKPIIEAGKKINGFENARPLMSPDSFIKGFGKIWLALAALLILAAIIGGGYFWRQSVSLNSAETSFANVSIRQLTTNGKVTIAALAPDGKTFAYVVNDSGNRSLWLGYVDGGNHLQLRPGAEDARYYNLAFAPDSSRLYFSYKDDKTANAALYRTYISGGAQEKIFDSIESFALSPDGRQIAFGRREAEKDSLLIADLGGSNEREIASFPKTESFLFDSISWSPDGRRLAFSKAVDSKSLGLILAIVEISSGRIQSFENEIWRDTAKTVWLKDGSGVIISAVKSDSLASVPQYQVFQIEIPSGITRPITNDLSSYNASLDLSQKNDMILTVEHRQLNNIWIAPSEDLSAARQITFGSFGKHDGLWGLDFTPDGKLIYVNSDTKSQFISEMNADGSSSKPLTAPGVIDSQLSVSNDGRYIIFQSNRTGDHFNIWRMNIDGGNPKQLTFDGKNFQSFVSADSRYVYYKSWGKGIGELRRVSIDGGEPEILNDRETSWLSFSPDGKYFAAAYKTDKTQLAIFDAATNQVVKQFDFAKNGTMSIGSRWSPDSRRVAYRDWNDGYWLQSIEGGEPQKMEGLPKEKFYNFAWSKDGKQFAFVRGQEIRDVVLINNEK
jgi:predicted ATPase/DNA-binding winged helix-turn-helix (wHTH) protein/Tol biopolymer transport system component